MTALYTSLKAGDYVRVLPGAGECLCPGEILQVRDRGDTLGMRVHCDLGEHFLMPDKDGVLQYFEHVIGVTYEPLLVGEENEER